MPVSQILRVARGTSLASPLVCPTGSLTGPRALPLVTEYTTIRNKVVDARYCLPQNLQPVAVPETRPILQNYIRTAQWLSGSAPQTGFKYHKLMHHLVPVNWSNEPVDLEPIVNFGLEKVYGSAFQQPIPVVFKKETAGFGRHLIDVCGRFHLWDGTLMARIDHPRNLMEILRMLDHGSGEIKWTKIEPAAKDEGGEPRCNEKEMSEESVPHDIPGLLPGLLSLSHSSKAT